MLKKILSISGKPGLYRLVSNGKNMLIVESLATGKRMPAYAHDKVVSLGDISMYTTDEDIPLADVLEKVKEANGGKPVDVKAIGNDEAVTSTATAFTQPTSANFSPGTTILSVPESPSSRNRRSPRIRLLKPLKLPTRPLQQRNNPPSKIQTLLREVV